MTTRYVLDEFVTELPFDCDLMAADCLPHQEEFVGLSYTALLAAYERGEMRPVRALQHLIQVHMHSATYLVGHSLSGDLKVLRLHGPELEARVVDTQALYPLPAGVGHARLKALVEDMLPAEAWRHFQAVGAAHPPDQDANAALELVTRELELLLEQPQRRIGVWSSSDGSGGNCGVLRVGGGSESRAPSRAGRKSTHAQFVTRTRSGNKHFTSADRAKPRASIRV